MRRYRILQFFLLSGLLFFTFSSCVYKKTSVLDYHPDELSYPSIAFTPKKPERVVLSNGMVLYLMEDREIPLITINTAIGTGAVYEPADKVGLAEITGEVMRTGGTAKFSAEELDKKLEYMGVIIETSIGLESGTASVSVLKKDYEDALSIFSQILRYPVFAQDKVEIAKMGAVESVRRQNDQPINIASREFKRKIYEKDPRGRVRTIKAIEGITKKDLIDFYNRFYFPNNIIMGISGDLKKEEMIESISKYFGDWGKRIAPLVPPVPIPAVNYSRSVSVIYAYRPLPQATIVLGHLCCPKNHPDFYSMEVLNYILGDGGFNSRLTKEIRSDRGLAYSVGSFYRGAIDYGVFGAYAMTKSNTTGKVIDLIINEIDHTIDKGVSEEELMWAKDSIINKFIFSFASTASLVKSYITLEYEKLPEDFLETYPERISKITSEDIQKAARRYLRPNESVIVVVGDALGFDKPLNNYGEIEEADLTIQ